MAIAICSECGSYIEYEIGEEFAYCPICECDQVEIKKKFISDKYDNLTNKLIKKEYELNIYKDALSEACITLCNPFSRKKELKEIKEIETIKGVENYFINKAKEMKKSE